MANHCPECNYRERMRRIKALPAEATRRINALRTANGQDRPDAFERANAAYRLYKWVYGDAPSFGGEETTSPTRKQLDALEHLVNAIVDVQENIEPF